MGTVTSTEKQETSPEQARRALRTRRAVDCRTSAENKHLSIVSMRRSRLQEQKRREEACWIEVSKVMSRVLQYDSKYKMWCY